MSLGELADKITILQIKSVNITDPRKLANVRIELESLGGTFKDALNSSDNSASLRSTVDGLVSQLKTVNETLWVIEDEIRDCERLKDFGPKFIELARSVYRQNDKRAALKRQINDRFGSRIVEEKSYHSYDDSAMIP